MNPHRTQARHAPAHTHRGKTRRIARAWGAHLALRAGLMGGGQPAIDAIDLSLKIARVVSEAARQVRVPSVGVDRRVRAAGGVQRAARVGSVDGPSVAGAQCGWEGGVPHGLAAVLRRE